MKLLVITQSINKDNPICGFFLDWVLEFSKKCEKVIVICLEKGEYNLPNNVKVLSLGKEDGENNLKYVFNFYKYIWQERNNYDNVFVHMNQVYVIMGALFWRVWNKKIALWYAHGSIPFALRVAEKMTNVIFSASKESFRLKSEKLRVVGHGIDVDRFKVEGEKSRTGSGVFKMVTIGRISPVKDYGTLIKAVEELKKMGVDNFVVDVIGGPGIKGDEEYLENLKKEILMKGLEENIVFLGKIPNSEIPKYLSNYDLFVHMSKTGSLDKVVLEAMAMELPIISCNDASKDLFGDIDGNMLFTVGDYKDLARKMNKFILMPGNDFKDLGKRLRERVVDGHDLAGLISKIISSFK